MAERWVQTSETEDVAGSIRHAIRVAQFVDDDSQAWKWIALALHSALQGACVCHLTTSAAPLGAVTKRNAAEWLTYFEDARVDPSARAPKTQLLTLPDLLKAARKPYSAGDRSNSSGIAISDPELSWLRSFHDDIRNQFVHFEPMGWSIEVSGLPKIAALTARIITEIMQAHYAFRHLDSARRGELLENLRVLTT